MPYLPFLINRNGDLTVPIPMVLHCLKNRLIKQYGMAFEPILPGSVFLEVPTCVAQRREGVSVLDGRTPWSMNHLQCNTEVLLMMF